MVGAFLSHMNPCFQCNMTITKILVSHTREIRFHDVIDQNTPHMYSYAKILEHNRPTWPNEYLQKHVRKVVGGFGKKSCVSTGVRKPGNTYASPTAMI